MDKYKVIGRAGEGAHGFVFKALDKRSLKIVALKKISVNVENGIPKNTLREILSLRALKSEYVVGLFDVVAVSSGITLVMEYLPCSLVDILRNTKKPIELPQIKLYMKMFLTGVSYIHSKKIIHRDLKPANLLISELGILKLADFGLARIFKEDENRTYSHQVATRWYRAPELLYGSSKYTFAIDMWSVGCILAEMENKKPLFPGETDIEQLAIVLNTLGTPNEEVWPGLTELPDYNKITFTVSSGKSWDKIVPHADEPTLSLIKNLVQYNHKKRLTASEALNHSFFYKDPQPCNLDELPSVGDLKTNGNIADFEDMHF